MDDFTPSPELVSDDPTVILDTARRQMVLLGQTLIRRWLDAHNAPAALWELFDVTATLSALPPHDPGISTLMQEAVQLINRLQAES